VCQGAPTTGLRGRRDWGRTSTQGAGTLEKSKTQDPPGAAEQHKRLSRQKATVPRCKKAERGAICIPENLRHERESPLREPGGRTHRVKTAPSGPSYANYLIQNPDEQIPNTFPPEGGPPANTQTPRSLSTLPTPHNRNTLAPTPK